MKWMKRWSFVIMLVITGIIYFMADQSLLKISGWQSLDPMGEEKSEEDWELLHGEDASDAAPEETEPEGAASQEDPQGTLEQAEDQSVAEETNPAEQEESVPGEPGAEDEVQEPVITFGRVEDSYFADALFLGDSRVVGMYEYGGLEEIATFYASTGMSIYKLLDAQIVEVPGQDEKITIDEALQQQSFGKIYIMVGINEMGTGTVERYAETYKSVVDRLRELQPEALIYIQAILKVTTERSNKGDYINNEGIEARNQALSQLADGQKVFYVDANPAVCDEDGGLIKDYTFDGVHLKAKYINLWKEFLKDNAVLLDGQSGAEL